MAGSAIEITDASFEQEVLKSDIPVLVDFWATWCGPCRHIAPLVEELAVDFAGKAKIGKIDLDESPGTAGDYGVASIPTLILFKNGEEVERIVGAQPKSVMANMIAKHT